MKRSSKLMCGLLMSWLCFRATGLDEKISVIQSPDNIAVNKGESANITCCWTTMTKEIFNVKVGWFKNETRVSAENRLYQKSPSQNCSTLHITHITHNDTGEYMCKVTQDIPILREYNGSKTHLTLTTEQQRTNATTTKGNDRSTVQPNPTNKATSPKTAPHLILYLSLAAVVGLLTICLVFTVCRTRNHCKNTGRVVIRQTPHNEGEEHENHEEEELSSGSSRGSLQWYQVPVYWSYFDVQSAQDQ